MLQKKKKKRNNHILKTNNCLKVLIFRNRAIATEEKVERKRKTVMTKFTALFLPLLFF